MARRIVTGVLVGAAALALALGGTMSSALAGPSSAHGDDLIFPLTDDLELVPLVPPKQAPPVLPKTPVTPTPPAPPPTVEIIRWKKKKVRPPRQPNVSRSGQTFNGYITGSQSAAIQWSIAGVDPGPCILQRQATTMAFASTRPVLVSAGPRSSFSISTMPVTVKFASSIEHTPDIAACFGLKPSNDCVLNSSGMPGTATIQTRGDGRVVRSIYLQSISLDEAKAGSTCTDGLYGFPDILLADAAVGDARIPWGAVLSRSGQNVNIGQGYELSGNQDSQPAGTCTAEGDGWTCGSASVTKWNLRLVRAPQLRIPGLR